MLGSATALAIQESRRSQLNTFHAMRAGLDQMGLNYRTGPFESIIVNDEYVWENYGIPMVSFSRFPYPSTIRAVTIWGLSWKPRSIRLSKL